MWHEPEYFGGAAIPSGIGGSTDAHWTSLRGPFVTDTVEKGSLGDAVSTSEEMIPRSMPGMQIRFSDDRARRAQPRARSSCAFRAVPDWQRAVKTLAVATVSLLCGGCTETPANCRDEVAAAFERLRTSGRPTGRTRPSSSAISKLITKLLNSSRPTGCDRSRTTAFRAMGWSNTFGLVRERGQSGQMRADGANGSRANSRRISTAPVWTPRLGRTAQFPRTPSSSVLAGSNSRARHGVYRISDSTPQDHRLAPDIDGSVERTRPAGVDVRI
jgi:hypothetical protein